MGRPKKNRSFTTESLGKDPEEKGESQGSTEDPKETEAPHVNSAQPSLDESPLLNAGRIEREYTVTNAPVEGQSMGYTETPPQTPPPNFTPPQQAQSAPTQSFNGPDQTANHQGLFGIPTPPPTNPYRVADAPGQEFIAPPPPSMDGNNGMFNVPEDLSKKQAGETAGAILDLYKSIVPELTMIPAKLNVQEWRKLESSGDLMEGAFNAARSRNNELRQRLVDKARDDARILKKPLADLCEIKNVVVTPETHLILAICAVIAGNFFLIRAIRSENESMMDNFINKRGKAAVQDVDAVPVMVAEEM